MRVLARYVGDKGMPRSITIGTQPPEVLTGFDRVEAVHDGLLIRERRSTVVRIRDPQGEDEYRYVRRTHVTERFIPWRSIVAVDWSATVDSPATKEDYDNFDF